MNKKENSNKTKATNSNHENISLKSKVIEKSLDSKIDFDSINSCSISEFCILKVLFTTTF